MATISVGLTHVTTRPPMSSYSSTKTWENSENIHQHSLGGFLWISSKESKGFTTFHGESSGIWLPMPCQRCGVSTWDERSSDVGNVGWNGPHDWVIQLW